MKATSILITIFASAVSFTASAQRTNIKDQEKVQRDYQREHTTQTKEGHTVTHDRNGNIKETWTSANGDKNTYEKSSDGRVTTTVEHADGTKDINGVRQGGESQGNENKGNGNQDNGNQGNGNQGNGNQGNGNQGSGTGHIERPDPMDRNRR